MTASAGGPGAQQAPNALVRLVRAWRALAREQRRSALAALALWITMFLPWYSETVNTAKRGPSGVSLSAWGSFGLVQLLVLLLSLGTLALLFVRGERRALAGETADSAIVVMGAGALAAVLVFYGMFDRPGGKLPIATGIEWGVVLALLAAIWLAWTGLAGYRAQRVAVGPGGVIEGRTMERLPTRREGRVGGPPPDAARWVEPEPSTEPLGRDERGGAAGHGPPASRPSGEAASARGDGGQLSLWLPHRRLDE